MCLGALFGAWGLALFVPPTRLYLVPVVAIGSAALASWGLWASRPPARRAWWTVAVGVWLLAIGYLVSAVDAARWPGLDRPYPQPYDGILIIGSATVVLGAILLLRKVHPSRDPGDLLDALVVAIGMGSMVVQSMFGPELASGEPISLSPVTAVLFPVASIVLLTAVVRALLTGGSHNPTMLLLTATVLAAVISDIPRAQQAASGVLPYDSFWACASVLKMALFAAAVVLPGVADPRMYAPARPALGSRSRLLLVSCLAFLGPILLTVAWLLGAPVDPRLPMSATVLILALSIIRIDGLLRRVEYRATHDPLTEVLDRGTFRTTVESIAAQGSSGWYVGLLDIDAFKHLNDTRGHLVGDQVLIIASRRLSDLLGREDVVGRFGGDEFAVAFRTEAPEATASAIVRGLNEPMPIRDKHVVVRVSLGVAHLPSQGGTAEDRVTDTLRRADHAMYSVKGSGREFAVAAD